LVFSKGGLQKAAKTAPIMLTILVVKLKELSLVDGSKNICSEHTVQPDI